MLHLFSVSVLFCLCHQGGKGLFFQHVNEYLHKSPCFTGFIAHPCFWARFFLAELHLDF